MQGRPRNSLRPRTSLGHAAEWLVLAIYLALLLFIVHRMVQVGINRFDSGWDFIAYHLPFAIKLFAPDQIVMHPQFEELFRGAPLALHYLIGLVWWISPTIPLGATHMLGTAAYVLFVVLSAPALGRYALAFALLSLAAPLVLIHSVSGYIDLPSNLLLFGVLVAIHRIQMRPPKSALWPWILFGLVSLGLCASAKFTLMPLALVTGVLFAITVYQEARLTRRTRVVIALLAVCLAAAWGIRNSVVHLNPIYPIKVPLIGDHLPHKWAAPDETKNRPAKYAGWPQPLVTVASILEIDDPQMPEGQPRYTVDQVAGGPEGPAHRMGGFWTPALAAALIVIVSGLWRGYLSLKEILPFMCLVSITLLLPQSHELRYYLYIPITLAFFAALAISRSSAPLERVAGLTLILCVTLASWATNWVHLTTTPNPLERVSSALGARVESAAPGTKICGRNMGFALVLLAGPTLREHEVMWVGNQEDCPKGAVEVVGASEYGY